jgi:hypothetical protein
VSQKLGKEAILLSPYKNEFVAAEDGAKAKKNRKLSPISKK